MANKYVVFKNTFAVWVGCQTLGEATLLKAKMEEEAKGTSWTIARLDKRMPNAFRRCMLWASKKLEELS